MEIGILLTSSPEHANTYTVGQLSSSFLKAGHRVQIFLMDDGVYNAVKTPSKNRLFSNLDQLIAQGAKVYLCAVTAEARGLGQEDFLEGVEFSSQYELSYLVEQADRFLAFG
jgi:sulfur relay (sulfurtransferase) complex TusBCD TusD component (DsrE family)